MTPQNSPSGITADLLEMVVGQEIRQ